MKKLSTIALTVAMLASCGGQPQTDEEIREAIKEKQAQVDTKKEEIDKLMEEIKELEAKLSDSAAVDKQYLEPVTIKSLGYEEFTHSFEVSGTVEAKKQAYISPEGSGQIRAIYVEEGQKVYAGQMLASLNTSVISNSIEEIKTALELAKEMYEKQKRLREQNIGSEVQYLQAKNNYDGLKNKLSTLQAQQAMSIVSAPFSGIVDRIDKKVGELAMPGVPIMELVNLNGLKINADVPESYLSSIGEGDTVTVHFPAYGGMSMRLPINRTSQVVNPNNRTFEIELLLDNVEDKLKPNIIALVRMSDYQTDSALTVPSQVIQRDTKGSYVYIVNDGQEGKVAKKTYITPGKTNDQNEIEVLEGLEPGMQVIVDGYNMVNEGSAIRIVKR